MTHHKEPRLSLNTEHLKRVLEAKRALGINHEVKQNYWLLLEQNKNCVNHLKTNSHGK